MKLTFIAIKNFKGIDERGVTVNIAPITLLFGPNNAGKSTVIQALHLAREVFSVSTPDFDKIESYGKGLNLGKFVDYIHNHDLTKSVSVKLNFDEVIFPRDSTEPETEETIKNNNFLESIDDYAVEFEISWNFKEQKPLLSGYHLSIAGKKVNSIVALSNDNNSHRFEFEITTNETDIDYTLIYILLYDCFDKTRVALEKMIYTGPVREQPLRGLMYPQKLSQERWATGDAVWDLITTADRDQIDLLNAKMLQLGLDYQVVQQKLLSLDYNSELRTKLAELLLGDFDNESIPLLRKFLEQQPEVKLKLENIKTKVHTEIKDMGLGISQILPILGATVFAQKNAFIAIEEPESHIHPKLQVNLGDVIIESALSSGNTPTFLIETHSEHLMLRFLRRIRQTDANEAPSELTLTPQQIAVNWIGSRETQTYCLQLEIDEDGSFDTPWPEGFFSERRGEIFG